MVEVLVANRLTSPTPLVEVEVWAREITATGVDQARGLGCVVVVFGDQIHAARWVRRTHSTSPTAFTSFPGSIGYLAEKRVVVWNRPDRLPRIAPEQATRAVRAAVATLGLGDDWTVLEAIGATVDGLVVAGFGVGHVPAACLDALTALAIRMPVVLASRTGSGPVLTETYGFPGSESDLPDLARNLPGLAPRPVAETASERDGADTRCPEPLPGVAARSR
jgi:L-asparaginase